MRIGIIAEGHADQFVLRNMLYAFDIEEVEKSNRTQSKPKRFCKLYQRIF